MGAGVGQPQEASHNVVLPPGALPGSHSAWEKPPRFPEGEGERNHSEIPRVLCSWQGLPSRETASADPNLLGFHQRLTYLGGGKYPTPAPCCNPVPPKGEGGRLRSTGQVHSPVEQLHQLTKTLRPSCRTMELFPCPTPHHHITTGPFTRQFLFLFFLK